MSDTELTSMPEPARRLEIFTGHGRRRSWSTEQKGRIVAETLGGESVSAVARRHGLTPQQVFAWRRQVGVEKGSGSGESGFASVVVLPSTIEIVLCGMTIRVPNGSEASALRAVLQAVKAVA